MRTISAGNVKNNFGSVSNIVKGGESITITQYGTPTMMILPFNVGEEALRIYKAISMCDFMSNMASVKEGAPELSLEEINDIIHE